MDLTKIAKVSAYAVAGFFSIAGLLTGKGLFPVLGIAYTTFYLVRGVILTPSYFMEGLRGTPAPNVSDSGSLDTTVGERDDE